MLLSVLVILFSGFYFGFLATNTQQVTFEVKCLYSTLADGDYALVAAMNPRNGRNVFAERDSRLGRVTSFRVVSVSHHRIGLSIAQVYVRRERWDGLEELSVSPNIVRLVSSSPIQ